MSEQEFVEWAKAHDVPRPKSLNSGKVEFFKKTIAELKRLMPWASTICGGGVVQ